MNRDDETLRDLVSGLGLGANEEDRCELRDEIFRAVRGELAAERVRQLIDHAIDCPACADAFYVARELVDETAEVRSHRGGWLRYGGWAAAAMLTLVVGYQGLRSDHPPDAGTRMADVTRGEADNADAIEFETSAGTTLPRHRCRVRWRAHPSGRYRVVVSESSRLSHIASSGSSHADTSFRVDPEALASLPVATELTWAISHWIEDELRWSDPGILKVFC